VVAFIQENHAIISHVQIKDRTRNGGANERFGEGDTPIKDVLTLIREKAALRSCVCGVRIYRFGNAAGRSEEVAGLRKTLHLRDAVTVCASGTLKHVFHGRFSRYLDSDVGLQTWRQGFRRPAVRNPLSGTPPTRCRAPAPRAKGGTPGSPLCWSTNSTSNSCATARLADPIAQSDRSQAVRDQASKLLEQGNSSSGAQAAVR